MGEAINGGRHLFEDVQGRQHLMMQAGNSMEFLVAVGALTAWTDPTFMYAEKQFEYGKQQYDRKKQLQSTRDAELKQRVSATLGRIRQNIDAFDKSEAAAKEKVQEGVAVAISILEEQRKQAEAAVQDIEERMGELAGEKQALIRKRQELEIDLETRRSVLSSVKAYESNDLQEKHKSNLEKLRKHFVGFEGDTLYKLLAFFKAFIEANRVLMRSVLESFEEVAAPVGYMINQLNQKHQAASDENALPHKVVDGYRNGTGLPLPSSFAEFPNNWKKIVKFHCPTADDEHVEMFADALPLPQWCFDKESMDKKELKEKEKQLENDLVEYLSRHPDFADLMAGVEDARRDLQVAEDEVRSNKGALRRLEEAGKTSGEKPAPQEVSGCQREIATAQRQEESARNALGRLEDQLRQTVTRNRVKVLSMLRKVWSGVCAIHDSILIANGTREFETNLKGIGILFGTTIKNYCAKTLEINDEYMDNSLHHTAVGYDKLFEIGSGQVFEGAIVAAGA